MSARSIRIFAMASTALALLGAAAPAPAVAAAESELIQCLLPQAVRRLGPIAYLPQRRIVAVPAEQCGRLEGAVISPERALAISESQVSTESRPDGGM